jgi:hypothetical protein
LTPTASTHETESLGRFLYFFTEHSIKLRATQLTNPKYLVVRIIEMAKLTTGPEGQVDERKRPLCWVSCWSMESSPRCLFGCCAVDIGDVESRCLLRLIAGDGEGVLRVRYDFVLGCDALVNEDGAVSGFARSCEDGGNGVAYCWDPRDADGCIASVDDCEQLC